jgi:hypothetical protein
MYITLAGFRGKVASGVGAWKFLSTGKIGRSRSDNFIAPCRRPQRIQFSCTTACVGCATTWCNMF